MRKNISSNTTWEDIVGYSRAVVIDNRVYVAGTTATDHNGNIIDGNAYDQAKQCLKNIEEALVKSGTSISKVYRTRMFITNINDFDLVGKAHGEYFNKIKPVTTLVEISKLVNPKMLIEIEAEAYI